MSIKTDLYEQWTATAKAAGDAMDRTFTASKFSAAEIERAAYEDGARILHEADGVDHVKKILRDRMGDQAMHGRRNHYASMLNDVETALESGGEPKAVADGEGA